MALDNGLLDLDFVLDHQQNLNDPICDPILQPENKVIENVSLGAASVEINRNDYALHSDIGGPFNNGSYHGIPGSNTDSAGDQPSIHTEAIMMETDCNTEVGNQTFLSSESNHLSDNESDFEELDLSADSHYHDGNPDINTEDVVVNKSSDLNVETAINSEVAEGKNGENIELVNDEDGGVEGGSEQNDFIQNQSEHENTNTDEQDLTDAGHHEDSVETSTEHTGNGSELGTATNEQNNDESAMTGEIDDADDEKVRISKSNVDDPVDESANDDVEHEDDEGGDEVNDEGEADEGEDSMEEGEMEESFEDGGEHGYDIQPTDNEALSSEQQSGVPTVKPIFLRRKRKRRRKSASKRWSKSPVKKSGFTPSPYKRRRLSESITEEKMDDSVGGEMLDKSQGIDEVTDDTLNDTAESTLSQGEDVDVGTPEGKTRRTSRPPDRQDFFIDDDQLLEEMWKQTDPSALYHKKRKSLLFNRGRKARTVVEKPVTEEEKERYSLPFKEGWKREIVIRGTTKEDSGKKNPPSDVYYFPPFGTKLRSMVQLTDWLRKHSSKTSLTIDNFTFMRRPIGIEEGEIVRNANISKRLGQAFPKKKKTLMKDEDIHDDNDPLYDKPEIVIERDSDDFLAPIIADSINPQTNTSPLNNSFPKKGRPRKKIIVLPPPKKEIFEDTPVLEMVHPSGDKCYIPVLNKSSKGTARKSTTPRIVKRPKPYTGVENLCSLKCPGLEDIPPLLHCNVCMCLFHDKCVRYFGDARKFTCLRCNTLKSPSQSDGSLMSPTTPEPMQLDPNLVKTLSKIPNGGQIHPPVNSNLLPTVIRSTPSPFRSMDSRDSNNVATTMPILAEKLQSKYTTSKGDNIEIIKSSVSDINMDLYIKEEPIDTSYPDPDVSVSEEEEERSTQTNVTSALSNYLHTKMITTSSQNYAPLHLNNSQQKQQPLKLGANSTPTLFTNNTLIRLPNSTYQLIPVGPPMPMPYNMRYPAAGQQQNVFTNVRPPGSLTSLSRLRAAQPPVPITSIRPTARPALSILRTPSPVPLQVSTNNLLQLSTAYSSLESSHSVSTSVTQTVWSKDSVVPPASPVVVNAKSCAPLNGQLLTLPPAAVKRLTLSKPLALKINNRQINVPPSGFFQTADGLKVFLPPNTFPFAEDNVVPGIETKSPDKSDSSSANDSSDKVESKTSDKEKTKYNLRASTRYQKLCFIKMLFGAYDCMEYIFKYLNLRDLISVGMVCRRWRTLAQNSSLWTNVNFNGMKVSDWKKAAQFMDRRQVKSMSLVGLEHYSDPHRTWHQLVSSSQDLQYLKKISFGVIPASVIHSLCSRLTRLESFYAEYIADPTPDSLQAAPTKIDIGKFACMTQLRELKIRGVHGLAPPSFSFSGGLMELGNLSDLEVLSVTSLHHVSEENFYFISQLLNIRELSLGNCTTWTQDTCERLGHLYGLEKLRLELGGEGCQNYIGEAIAHLKNLHTLELRAFPVAENLGSHLNCLKKLKKLVIYPPNTHNIARDNMNTLNAVTHLKRLKTLEWLLPDKKQLAIILDDQENAEEPENDLNSEYIPLLVTSSLSEDEEIVAAHTEYINAKELKERISQKLKNTTIYVKHCTMDDKMVGKMDK